MAWTQLYERGAAQRGVVSPRCAVACELDAQRFVRWARHSQLVELQHQVFLLPGWRCDAAARTFAAALAGSSRAVVTGWAALAQLRLVRAWPTTTELLVPHHDRRQSAKRVRTRWSAALPPSAVIRVGGVRFTDPARTLAHLAERTPLRRLRAIALDALQQDLLAVQDLERELTARARFPGRATIRQLARDLQGDGSESGFEFDARERLDALGLPPHDEQPSVMTRNGRDRRIDIAYPERLVGIDCVGFGYHSSPEDLEADVVRGNELAELDRWLILRLTFRMFHERWEPFVEQLRRCLAQRQAR